MNIRDRILTYGRMIKFSHTVFALPFALSAVVLAHRQTPIAASDILWVLVAMVGARSAAMGFNRMVDARFDAKNPRTANREIPSGRISVTSTVLFIAIFSILFIGASAMLGSLCFYGSFPVLAILFSYSYTKRFSWLSHLYLGLAISLAPIGAWIAVAKSLSGSVLLLSAALLTYIAGFDIIYACQDIEFDQQENLFSIPTRFGIKRALQISSLLHVGSFIFFILIAIAFQMSYLYWIAVGLIGWLLMIEHRLVKPDDFSRIHIAFFHVNTLISLIMFFGILADEVFCR